MFEESNAIYGKLNDIEKAIADKHEIQLFRFNNHKEHVFYRFFQSTFPF
jgi:hypothetical protein